MMFAKLDIDEPENRSVGTMALICVYLHACVNAAEIAQVDDRKNVNCYCRLSHRMCDVRVEWCVNSIFFLSSLILMDHGYECVLPWSIVALALLRRYL